MRGVRVIATAGDAFADRLRAFGAKVTPYGEGMVDRVLQLSQGAPDFVLDTSPANGALPDLIKIAGGNPHLVLTISDFEAAAKLGTRDTGRESNARLRYDVLGQFAKLAAEGRFTVPVSDVYRLEEWRAAVAVSQSGKAHGKLILLTGP
jgi:NADPH:quinone reductase-like Zn-dependent oxidoreductase